MASCLIPCSNAPTKSESVSRSERTGEDEEAIHLQIADDGRGFRRDADGPKSIGIESMKIRARALGGRLSIDTPNGGGTSVTLAMPKRK